jgi:hypothetical protein
VFATILQIRIRLLKIRGVVTQVGVGGSEVLPVSDKGVPVQIIYLIDINLGYYCNIALW